MRYSPPSSAVRRFAILAIILLLCPHARVSAAPLEFQLKLGLGLSELDLGELGDLVSAGEQRAASWVVNGTRTAGDPLPGMGRALDAHGELIARLSSRLSLGLEVGINGATRDGQVGWIESQAGSVRHGVEIRHTVVPVRLNLRYTLGRSRGLRAYLAAGAGIYPGRIYLWQNTLARDDGEERMVYFSGRGDGTALGVHLGAGLRLPISRRFDLFVEMAGQSVRIGALRGEATMMDTAVELNTMTEGTFWLVTRENESGRFQEVVAAAERPAGPDYLDAVELGMDLSGLTLRAGLIIRL